MVAAEAVVALDSNFLINARQRGSREAKQLSQWLAAQCFIQVSAVAWSEYRCGPLAPDELAITLQFINSIEPFLREDADLAGMLFEQTGRRSRSHPDCMIAAHAIRREAFLATANVAAFRPFRRHGLQLV
jgi:predicted nucleic acid-binding protein